MRFIRLVIRNFRGVEESAIDFAEHGITVVQGPNEAGKTSLAEAIQVLFEHKATTEHQDVKALKRIGADSGTEVELEAASGPYHFVYKKTFNKAKTATLDILAPAPANYSGGEAHQQANRILEETLDKTLWDALAIRQGNATGLPDIAHKTGLMAALDRAAGQNAAEQNEAENLFAKVEDEYHRYFTRDGRPNTLLAKSAAAAAKAREAANEYAGRLKAVEAASDRLAELRRHVSAQNNSLGNMTAEHLAYRKTVDEIGDLTAQINQRRLALGTIELELQSLEQAGAAREKMARAAYDLDQEAERIQKAVDDDELPRIAEREEEAEALSGVLAGAEEARRRAEGAASAARAAHDYARDALQLEQARKNKEDIDAARAALAEANREIAANPLTDAVYQQIKDAEQAVLKAEGRLRVGAPSLTVEGLGDCAVIIGDEETPIGEGETFRFPVEKALRLEVPGKVAVLVETGLDAAESARDLREAREHFASLSAAAGVADSREAFLRLREKKNAENTAVEKTNTAELLLRGHAYEDLAEQIRRLRENISRSGTARITDIPLPAALAGAKTALDEAERRCGAANAAWERARTLFAEGKARLDAALARRRELLIEKSVLEKQAALAASELAAARAEASDGELRDRLGEARERAAAERNLAHGLEAVLAGKNAGQATAMEKTLAASIAAAKAAVIDREKEIAGLEAELRARGDEDLFDAWQNADIEAESLAERHNALTGKAAAAELLHSVMKAEREGARKAYAAPLRQKIEELGRYVFNPSFRANLDEQTLSLHSRTLDGVTVPFKSLSGGAKEQLSLIFRAACAIIVAEREGMPLILDDPLGYTDDRRLLRMGAVLAKAAEQCQIIIFTCLPERFANLGAAKAIRLSTRIPD